MPFGWFSRNRDSSTSKARKSKKEFRSTVSLATPASRSLGDILGELLAYFFNRPAPADPSIAFEQLTPREREIAHLAAQGYTNKEIAAQLVIAQDTVKTHMRNILTKLGLHSKAELRLYWHDRSWCEHCE